MEREFRGHSAAVWKTVFFIPREHRKAWKFALRVLKSEQAR